MKIVKLSALAVTGLVAQQANATEETILESAYQRAEKAYHSTEWKELPDEALIRSNRIKWNRLVKAALNLPNWVEFSLSQRTRYENVSNNWRKGERDANNSQLPLQSRVHLGVNHGPFWLMFEGQDSRTNFNQPGDFTGRMIDQWDILQLFGSATFKNAFATGLRTDIHVGRLTMEIGNGRLVGRNNFPNTTNSFDGGHFALGNGLDWRMRSFLTAPVNIYPTSLDQSSQKTLFWGTAFESTQLKWLSGEVYYLGISDSNSPKVTSHRNFSTFGTHGYKKAITAKDKFVYGQFGDLDYDFESAVQIGERNGKNDFAYMGFATIGYTFNTSWIPQLQAEYKYASGTSNPNGNATHTFDKLYGLRRADFGQTSLYTSFGQSNIEVVGWRLTLKPKNNTKLYFRHHAHWLAQAKDAFDGSALPGYSNLQDKTGNAGRWLGQDVELIGEYDFGSNLILSAGYDHWFKGDYFAKLAATPGSGLPQNGQKDTNYFFVQTELRF